MLQFGVSLERIESNENGNSNPNGHFTFGSLQSFLTDQTAEELPVLDDSRGASPAIYLRQFVPGLYFRDDYRVLPNLTSGTSGLRYEMATVPTEKYARLSNLDSLTAATPSLGSPYFQNPTLLDFSPRAGFAWDPFHDGKTSAPRRRIRNSTIRCR